MNELSDYLSWQALINEKPHELTKHREAYDKFVKYINAIIITGYLPESIIQHTNDFLDKIIFSIANILLNCDISNIEYNERKTIIKYFDSYFDLGIYGAVTQEKSALAALSLILTKSNKPFYKEEGKKKIHSDLLKKLYSKGAIQAFLISIETSQNIELLSLVLFLTQQIEKYDPFFPHQEFYDISFKAIKRIVRLNKEIVLVKFLNSSLDSIQNCLPYSKKAHELFVKQSMPILKAFITSENLEQRSNALSQFLKYAENDMFKITVADFFSSKNRFALFSSVNLHISLSKKIGELMSIIVSNSQKLGKLGIIREIWNQHSKIKSKTFELSTFYDTFLYIGTYLKSELFDEFIDAILEAKPSFPWFEMIDKLALILSRKNDMKESFKKIREKLWDIINLPNDESNKHLLSLRQNAKNSFIRMTGFEPDDSDIIRIKNIQETDQSFFYELLNSFLENNNNINQKTVSEFLKTLLNDLPSSPSNYSPIIIKNIKQLCNLCSSLTNEQINLLINSIDYFPDFFDFMTFLCEKLILKSHNVLYISHQIKNKKFVNLEFYKFIKEFIFQQNPLDECITKLPITHEELIWKYAIKESPVKLKFARLLSRIYQMNDGKKLTDDQMIVTFLNKWNDYFIKKQNNETSIMNLLSLLWNFIDIYESNMYRNLNVFNTPLSIERSLDAFTVNAICEKPEFNIILKYPINYTIESVVEEIHEKFDNIGLNTTNIFLNGSAVKRSALISELAEDSDSIEIELKIEKEAIIPHKYHIRTEIPSRVIIKKNWHKIYFQQLIEKGSESAYEIMKLLPCDSKDLKLDEQLKDGNPDQIFNEIFDIKKPYLFSYNFLLIYFKTINSSRLLNQLIEYNIIKYLSDILIEFDPEPIYIEICDTFNYFIRNVLKLIKFDGKNKIFGKNEQKDLIFTLLALVEKGFNLNTMENTFDILLNYKKNELEFIEFPYIRLLFNENIQIRRFAANVFKNIDIDLNEYLKILREHDEDVNETFIQSLANRITSDIDDEIVYEIIDIIMKLQTQYDNRNGQFLEASLNLFEIFLKIGNLNFEKRQLILQLIIDRILTTEFLDDDLVAFQSATNCLSLLADKETYMLHKVLEELHSCREPFTEYSINGNKCSISKTGRVGLKRIGNTCYFNTIMQMLYAIKPIRNIIISYSGDDNFLIELSKLFVLMKKTKSRSINTASVLEYLTFSDGTKVDIAIQQDAAEFLQIIINKMHDVEELFCGSIVDIYEGIFVDFKTENEELFTILDLDVQNIPSLYNSFEIFSQSVDLTGSNQLFDEKSGEKIDVKKYSKIKKAPPFLIIHLKRFESLDLERIGTKIDDIFEIPFEFDISPFSTQQFPIYRLTGVIIHCGTSIDGHYICLSLTKKGWIKIDDVNSSFIDQKDAIKLIEGGTNQGSAYILFFTMDNDAIYPELEINPGLLEYAEKMNQMNNQKRLFCSINYFNIIKMLNNLTYNDYNDIVLRYTIDSLPFMEIRDKPSIITFYNNLIKKSKSNGFALVEKFHFLDYSINFLKEALLLCPYEIVRKKTADLILANLNEKANPHKFLIFAFDLMKESLNNPTHLDQVFYLIFSILKNYMELKESEQTQGILYDLLEKDLIPFINNTPNFLNVDMTYILEIVIMYNVFDRLNKDNFLYQLFISNTCIDSVVCFVKLAFKDNEKEIAKFIKKNISQISIQKYVPFCFFYHPDSAIEVSFLKLENKNMKVSGIRNANEFDLVCIFADMLSKCQSLSKYFINDMEAWVPRFLFNQTSSNIRKIALSIFSYAIPHENLKKWNFISDNKIKSNQPKVPYELNFASIKDNSQLNVSLEKLCLKVLHYLLRNNTVQFICDIFAKSEKDIDDNFVLQFFQLIDEILLISSKEFDSKELKNILKIYEIMIKYQKNPFSDSIIQLLNIIFKYQIQISQDSLEDGLKEIKSFSKYISNKSNSDNLISFLSYYLQIYEKFEPSKSFLIKFITHYLFSSEIDSSWTPVFEYFNSILTPKVKNTKKNSGSNKIAFVILGIIDKNFKNFAANNFSSLIFILNRIKEAVCLNDDDDNKDFQKIKRPILSCIEIITKKPQYLNINEIVRIAFNLNKGDVDEQVIKAVIEKYRYEIDEDNLNRLKTFIADDESNDNSSIHITENLHSSSSYNDFSDSSSG